MKYFPGFKKMERCFKKGFTLIELMMVMVVMSLLVGVMTVMGSAGLSAFSRAKEEAEIMRNVTATFEIIRRDILGSVYLNPATGTVVTIENSGGTPTAVNFLGINAAAAGRANDQIRFYAFGSPDAANLNTDLSAINYRLDTVNGVNRFSRAALPMDTATGLPPLDLNGVEPFEPLLFNVAAFDATYLNNPAGAYATTYNASTAGSLPRAVRLRLFVRNANGKERAFTQTVALPMP